MGWVVWGPNSGEGWGPNSGEGKIFCACPAPPWGPPSLLYNQYQVSFPGVKQPGCGLDHPPPLSSTKVNGKVELYLYSHFGPSWPVLKVKFTLYPGLCAM